MKILAIDFNSLMNRSFYAIRHLSNREGFETNALFGFTKTYLKLLATHSPDVVIAAYDLHVPSGTSSTTPIRAPAPPCRRSCGPRCPWDGNSWT